MINRTILRAWWPISLLVTAGIALATNESVTEPVRDPLDRPSMMSEKAATSLITAVTRAGARLVAVGDRGIVLTSDDNGNTWTQRPSPVSVLLTNVRFADGARGWAIGHGGVILSTVDGGLNWSKTLDGVQLAALILKSAQERADALPEAGTGEAAVRAAKDVDTARLLVDDGPDKPFLDLHFDEEIGLLVVGAFGLVLHSSDDGATWESWQGRVPDPISNHLYAVVRSGGALYLVGEQGSVFRSDDLGQNFVALQPPYEGSFFGAVAVGERDLIVFGLRGNAFVYRDEARAWQRVELPTSATVNGGQRVKDGSIMLVTQAGEVLRSIDDARTFERVKVPTPVPFVGIGQAADDIVVLAGVRGITLVSLKSLVSRS